MVSLKEEPAEAAAESSTMIVKCVLLYVVTPDRSPVRMSSRRMRVRSGKCTTLPRETPIA